MHVFSSIGVNYRIRWRISGVVYMESTLANWSIIKNKFVSPGIKCELYLNLHCTL
jgi:hypothetical protein